MSAELVEHVATPERRVVNVEHEGRVLAAVDVSTALDSFNPRLPHTLRVIVRLDVGDVGVFFEVRPAVSPSLDKPPVEIILYPDEEVD